MRSRTGALLLTVVLGALSGCVVHTSPAVSGYAVYEVDSVPYDIYGRPRVQYDGRWAYFVDGYWYYQGPAGWVVFRDEPPDLYRYRTHVLRAPPAYRAPPRVYSAPPARRYGPQVAPPAR